MKIKSVILLFALALSLSAFAGGKYAGVPKKYHALLDRAMVTAGGNAKELKKALKEVPASEREGMAFGVSNSLVQTSRMLLRWSAVRGE